MCGKQCCTCFLMSRRPKQRWQPTAMFFPSTPSIFCCGTWAVTPLIRLLFVDESIMVVERRQFIPKTSIVQTKLKTICGIKLWPSFGFPCFGKYYFAKPVHVYFFNSFLHLWRLINYLFLGRWLTYSVNRMGVIFYSMLILRVLFLQEGKFSASVVLERSACPAHVLALSKVPCMLLASTLYIYKENCIICNDGCLVFVHLVRFSALFSGGGGLVREQI